MGKVKDLKDILKIAENYTKSMVDGNTDIKGDLVKQIENKIKQGLKMTEEKVTKVAEYFDDEDIKEKAKNVKNEYLKSKVEADRNDFKNNNGSNNKNKSEVTGEFSAKNVIEDISLDEIKKAVLYSEILGKPRCKTRRRRMRHGV